jgi:Rieske Fe-S protein
MPCANCQHCGCDVSASESPGRRSFMATLLAGLCAGGAALLAPARALAARKIAIRLSKVPALRGVGGWMVIKIFGKPILLIRDSESSVRALTAICSHKRTTLAYDPKRKRVVCANHGSWFTLEGVVKKGPATKNLAAVYKCRLDRNKQRILLEL